MTGKRFSSGDVTETLISATEAVTELRTTHAMVLLYTCEPGTENYRFRIVCSDSVAIETANWMLDKAKFKLFAED